MSHFFKELYTEEVGENKNLSNSNYKTQPLVWLFLLFRFPFIVFFSADFNIVSFIFSP